MTIDFSNTILFLPEKDDVERNNVEFEWMNHNGKTLRIARFWEPPTEFEDKVILYGNHIFCLVVAQILKLNLISPNDSFVLDFEYEWVKRKLEKRILSEGNEFNYPCFVKTLIPKLFTSKVYNSFKELIDESNGVDTTTEIILSEEVLFQSEARAFILDGQVETIAFYEGEGDIEDATNFLNRFLTKNKDKLVKTFVVDIGFIKGRGWGIVEANAIWGAGLNGCDPLKVAKCLLHSIE